jgi:stage IV sporulation protein FB
VLLGEPPRTQYDLNFSLFGIPIRVHPWFWLITLMLGYRLRDPASVMTWIVAVFLSVLVHELGHAAAMRAYGFHPWITLYSMGGQAAYDQGQAYRSKGSGPLGQILICLAGPAAGFLLAAVIVLGLMSAGYGDGIFFTKPWGLQPVVLGLPNERLNSLINFILFISVMWGMVNLLPVYPLDGGQIARELLLLLNPRDGIRQSLLLSILTAGGMAAVGIVQWQSWFVGIMFGFLAFESYTALAAYSGRNPW